ncbi:HI0074 family nucleotidyltransferase substrate-binding subunit [Pararhodonellum marinum]|uniref:HI0074 family nucleotidyltransferase substrate-binding subunit n=1 Tax=Pararhodonellum marinum TaxID=2755358 RepID=UPI00188ECFF6|nr:HI0074 family nucleotidyltransferase substrate-binding subunit [Pararhodonellum marinum]
MKPIEKNCEKCLEDFKEALNELKETIDLAEKKEDMDRYGHKIIRTFELTHELALTTMAEYFRKESKKTFSGSRDTTLEAFHADLIDDGSGWLEMIICRIKITPIYEANHDRELIENIRHKYLLLLENFGRKMSRIVDS